ncbi:hypothetical protein H5410_013052 [Solanum commersonii]|uniref:Uncharacterized protein n=1 Tax=Solanum commersonii TaxID=4109 RepID=A0A9J6AUC8_SOLCO|nr:hypothetical protein H5410_013052 [Solanum commersonii]
MNELWNKWRGHLHAKYVKDKPIQQSLKNVPRGVDKKEWKWLVNEHFASESFSGKYGNPPDLATIFFETHKKDNKLVEPEAIEKHVHLAQLEEIDIKSLNEENKSLNEENKSLNDRLSTIEDEMKKIMK